MPRVIEPIKVKQELPWEDWGEMLLKSETGALLFDEGDFGGYGQRAFIEHAKTYFRSLDATVHKRGDEVMVVRHA